MFTSNFKINHYKFPICTLKIFTTNGSSLGMQLVCRPAGDVLKVNKKHAGKMNYVTSQICPGQETLYGVVLVARP